jgi:hypothetical protein
MAAWTPALLPALQSWFDAQDSDTITLDGSSRLDAWVDKGPAGITLGNTTPTERPNEGAINGHNAINFDGSQWLEPDSHPISLNESKALTIYIVFEVDDNTISNRPLSLTYDNRELFDYYNFSMSRNAGVLDVSWGRGTNTASFSFTRFRTEGWDTDALTPYLYGVSITTAGAVARHDGAAQALTDRSSGTMTVSNFLADAGSTPDVGVQLGCYNNAGAISQEMDGRIGEIIICNADESLFDKQRIEGYLAHKWDLEGDLPSDHPFKAAPPEVPQDPYYSDVFLQLPFDGADGDTSTASNAIDPLAVSFFGTAQLDDAQKKFGDTSLVLDGNSDYLTIGTVANWKFLHDGTEDYTAEFWFRVNAATGTTQILYDTGLSTTMRGASAYIVDSSGTLTLTALVARGTSGTYAAQVNGATALSTGTWYHCAVVVSGTQLELFLNGSSEGTATIASPSVSNCQYPLNIGRYQQGNSAWFNGHIDDFRVTKGVARYLGDFAPPDRTITGIAIDAHYDDVTLLLPFEGTDGDTSTTDRSAAGNTVTFEGTAQIDDSRARYGDTALLLDGDSDYLTADTALDDVSATTDPWTIEGWFYPTTLAGSWAFFGINNSSDGANVFVPLYDEWAGISGGNKAYSTPFTANEWQHFAASYDGARVRVFRNGAVISDTAQTIPTALSAANFAIGAEYDSGSSGTPGNYFPGSVDGVRFTAGFARYTAAFTPPEAPFYIPPTTAPVLTSASGSATGSTTLDGSVSTDTSNGTLYWVVTTSATAPSVAQVQAGQDHTGAAAADDGSQTVSVIGTQNINATGLTAETTYYLHFQHQNAGTDDSTVVSSASIATDAAGPTIDTQPQAETVDENTTAEFTIAATTSGGALSYQWQEDTGSGFADLTGETGTTLSFTAVEADDGNEYRCVVTDDNGSANSSAALLTVTALTPTIGTQPQSATVGENTTATFTVVATASAGSLSYQWYDASDDSELVGETADTLSFTAVLADNGNTYYVVVTDSNSSIQSSTATLTVTDLAPTIDTQPQDASIGVSESGVLSVSATASAGSLSYQWYRDAVLIPGETGSSLTVQGNIANDGIDYYVIVSDINGSVQSSSATITIIIPPIEILIDLPATTAVTQYTTPTLEVSVKNFLSAQWYEVGVGAIAGETKQKLSLYITPDDDGRQFYVAVTDRNGETGNSATTTLSVISTSLVDSTDAPAGSTFDASNPVRHRTVDWGAQMAAVDKEVIDVPDYEFSGRTFTRRDRLRNPK